jgi:hypothetical protein
MTTGRINQVTTVHTNAFFPRHSFIGTLSTKKIARGSKHRFLHRNEETMLRVVFLYGLPDVFLVKEAHTFFSSVIPTKKKMISPPETTYCESKCFPG